jgi:tRNA (mo5U34)-methyltransferase
VIAEIPWWRTALQPERARHHVRRAIRRFGGPPPDGVPSTGALRGIRTVAPGLVLADIPTDAAPRRLDPELGVEWIQDRIDRRRAAPDVTGDDALAVAVQPWYHTIDLPGGTTTAGVFDHRDLVRYYGLPDDLSGRRALDVATADGFWAFELERRGASVTALDVRTTDDIDLPPAIKEHAAKAGVTDSLGDGFALAHRLLQSSVERVDGTVYDLDPDRIGVFDLVHCGDLLIHLRDPCRALQQLRAVTGGWALLSEPFDPSIPEEGLVRYLGGASTAGWSIPSLGALTQMVVDAGFTTVDIVTVYRLALRNDPIGPWRAVLRATP